MKQSAPYNNGQALSYAEYGDKNGYPLLIQHGLIASISDDDLFEQLIAWGTRLICIARPGYGESSPYLMNNMAEWADIASVLIDTLQLSQFDVLGLSSGAPYSYALGYKFPARVRNIFVLSGIPALYDDQVLSLWPYPVNKNASMAELEKLAGELFFSNVANDDLQRNDIKDSTRHHCFGIAQDLRLRCQDWGFRLSEVPEQVYMQHSQWDTAVPVSVAELTAQLLPNCRLAIRETDVHFSKGMLNDFIKTVMASYYHNQG
jgi:pimeloyl-ACP methyl ester carboxylesterase